MPKYLVHQAVQYFTQLNRSYYERIIHLSQFTVQVRDQSKPEKFGQSTVVINVRRNSQSPVIERTPYGAAINYNQAPGPVYTTSARDPDLTVRIILLQYFISKIKPHVRKVYCHRITFCTRNSFEIFIKVWIKTELI